MPTLDDSKQILEALAHGVAGDDDAAWSLLKPIASRSDRAMYAVFCCLAESAGFESRQHQQPGEYFRIQVENVDTGAEASVDALPPGVRFAAQFTASWSNRDQDTAHALYLALYEAGPQHLAEGLSALYQMAVASLRAVVEAKRAAEDQ